MRRTVLFVASILVWLGAFVPSAPALSLGVNFFYDDLAPYGDWFQMEDYGWVWTPRHVAADWRPYTHGQWAFSDDYGWLWLPEEDFGWATDHYGRWFYDASYGWVWVPGTEWAPAWVSWRSGGGYVGWAPLPPEYRWRPGPAVPPGGFSELPYGPRQYVFISERHFFDPGVHRFVLPYTRNDSFVSVTRDVTRYDSVGDRIVNRGVSVREIEQAAGRRAPRYRVEEERSQAARRRPVVHGTTVRIFRPTPQQIEQAPAPRTAPQKPGAVARVRARPTEPPADPRAARHARPPAAAPERGDAARPEAERQEQPRAERQRQQEQERQRRERARQQQQAREREKEQRREQQRAERQRQQEQTRQQQQARPREMEERRQQQLTERRRLDEERRSSVRPQVGDQQAPPDQQQARERAQQERERQGRDQKTRRKPRPPDKPNPPGKPNGEGSS